MVLYVIWWECKGLPLLRSHVKGRVEKSCSVKPVLEENLRRENEEIWQGKMEQNPKLFNGAKYRLTAVASERGYLELIVGFCDYKSFLTSNACESELHFDALVKYGKDMYNDERACISDPLGVAAVLVTSDRYVVLIRRSRQTGEFQGFVDTPGGHPDPPDDGMDDEDEDEELCEFVDILFDSIFMEITAEINLPRDSLCQPLLMGIARQVPSRGRPSASFLVRCTHSAMDVLQLYRAGGQEKDESTELLLVPANHLSGLLEASESDPAWAKFLPLTPSASFSLDMFQQVLDGD